MALEFKDYYAVLGVPRTATAEELRTAFRKLARLYHPDVAKDKKTAEEKFKEINEAYEVLGDPEKRRKYDTLGADWKSASGGAAAGGAGTRGGGNGSGSWSAGERHFDGTGFSDFFEQFFGGGVGRPGALELRRKVPRMRRWLRSLMSGWGWRRPCVGQCGR